MKRAAKLINKLGSPNCHLVSPGFNLTTLELSNLQYFTTSYQLAFVTPGIFPSWAN